MSFVAKTFKGQNVFETIVAHVARFGPALQDAGYSGTAQRAYTLQRQSPAQPVPQRRRELREVRRELRRVCHARPI